MTATLPAQAVLFDCDGVLVDSKATAEEGWTEWARRHGLDPQAVLDGMHGRRSRETVAIWIADPAQREAATAEIDQLEIDTAGGTLPIPGAAELLESIGDSAVVVTSAAAALCTARLAAAGIRRPARLVSSETVERGKPAPDPYLAAAALLGVPIERCVVVEDSENGILSARAAGVGAVVGVSSSAEGLGCDAVVPDLTRLRWADGVLTVD